MLSGIPTKTVELRNKIQRARDAYYNGQPEVADDVYDAWVDELSDLDAMDAVATAVGAAPVSEWVKTKHTYPMGSLEKVNTPEEMLEWLNSRTTSDIFVTEKLDGISLSLTYRNGSLVKASTRGDGYIGEDITVNALRMKGVKHTIPRTQETTVRGEIIIRKSDFDAHFKDSYANTRNAASGISKRYDGRGSENLSFLAYKVIEAIPGVTKESAVFDTLRGWGFDTPEYQVGTQSDFPTTCWSEYQQGKRDALDYDIDGLVVSLNDLGAQSKLGVKNLRPGWSIAYKFAAAMRETTLRAVVWQTGSIGRVTPVAQFDPVNLLGTTVINASLYNYSYITNLGLDVGSKVLVARANDVIPRVVRVTESTNTVLPKPSECSSCGGALAEEGEYLVCPNRDCPAQVAGRLSQWVTAVGVLEWGDTVLERLVQAGKAKTVPDLYRLTVSDLSQLDRLGEKSATKMVTLLHEKKVLPLATILGGLAIPGVAESTAKAIVQQLGPDKVASATVSDVMGVSGVGPSKAQSFVQWMRDNQDVYQKLLTILEVEAPPADGVLKGKSVCFTGSMSRPRGDLESMVVKAGGEVKNSVTKKLTLLVTSDTTTTKAQKAREYGVKAITEEEFLTMVGE